MRTMAAVILLKTLIRRALPPGVARHGLDFGRRLLARGLALQIPQVAGSLSFLSLFAFVPVAVLALAVMTALPAFDRWRAALQGFLAANLMLPSVGETVMRYVNQFAAKAGGLSLLGLAVFLATAITSLFTIERTLNAIWQARPRRAWYVRAALYWTLLTVAPLLLGASLALESYFWTLSLGLADGVRVARRLWTTVAPWLLSGTSLLILYRFLPGTPVRWKHAALGAFTAAALLELWKLLLGAWLANFPTYTVVYGAFAALPAFLSWLFALWFTVLMGALLAAEARWWRHPIESDLREAPARRFELALRVLALLAAPGGCGWMAASELVARLKLDRGTLDVVGELLERSDYIRRTVPPAVDAGQSGAADECWLLQRPASRMTLQPLHDLLWHGGAPSASAGRVVPDPVWLARPLDQLLAATAREA